MTVYGAPAERESEAVGGSLDLRATSGPSRRPLLSKKPDFVSSLGPRVDKLVIPFMVEEGNLSTGQGLAGAIHLAEGLAESVAHTSGALRGAIT